MPAALASRSNWRRVMRGLANKPNFLLLDSHTTQMIADVPNLRTRRSRPLDSHRTLTVAAGAHHSRGVRGTSYAHTASILVYTELASLFDSLSLLFCNLEPDMAMTNSIPAAHSGPTQF